MLNLYYLDYDANGTSHGITTYTSQYILGMRSQSDVRLTCIWLSSNHFIQKSKIDRYGVRHIHLPAFTSSKTTISEIEYYANFLIEIINEENAIIHLNWISHLDITKLVRWRIKCKVILVKHCIPWRDLITNDYRKFRKIAHFFETGEGMIRNEREIIDESSRYSYSDHIITVTDSARQSLLKLFHIDKKHTTTVKNGLDFSGTFEESRFEMVRLRSYYGYLPEDRIILFVGSLNVRKGVADLIEAFKLIGSFNKSVQFLPTNLSILYPSN